MTEFQTAILAILGGLVGAGGLFGARGLIEKLLTGRQQHTFKLAESEQVRENSLIEALVAVFRDQSGALIDLTKESLKTNQVLASNNTHIAAVIDGQNRDETYRFTHLKEHLERVGDTLNHVEARLAENNAYTAALVRTLGGNLEGLVNEVEADRKQALEQQQRSRS